MTVAVSHPPRRRVRVGLLSILSMIMGGGIGVAIVIAATTSMGPDRLYWTDDIVVPGSASATHPYGVSFHGASFQFWWPPAPPPGSASSGLTGVTVQITESSGAVDQTATGCGSCGGSHSWYSSDGNVGISWTDESFGTVTLLAAV